MAEDTRSAIEANERERGKLYDALAQADSVRLEMPPETAMGKKWFYLLNADQVTVLLMALRSVPSQSGEFPPLPEDFLTKHPSERTGCHGEPEAAPSSTRFEEDVVGLAQRIVADYANDASLSPTLRRGKTDELKLAEGVIDLAMRLMKKAEECAFLQVDLQRTRSQYRPTNAAPQQGEHSHSGPERNGEAAAAAAYWLIERGSPAEWWTGEGWTREAHLAAKFPTKEAARKQADWIWGLPIVGTPALRVSEHLDCNGPCEPLETIAALRRKGWNAGIRRAAEVADHYAMLMKSEAAKRAADEIRALESQDSAADSGVSRG